MPVSNQRFLKPKIAAPDPHHNAPAPLVVHHEQSRALLELRLLCWCHPDMFQFQRLLQQPQRQAPLLGFIHATPNVQVPARAGTRARSHRGEENNLFVRPDLRPLRQCRRRHQHCRQPDRGLPAWSARPDDPMMVNFAHVPSLTVRIQPSSQWKPRHGQRSSTPCQVRASAGRLRRCAALGRDSHPAK